MRRRKAVSLEALLLPGTRLPIPEAEARESRPPIRPIHKMATSDYLPIQPKGESLTEVSTLQQPAYQPLPPSVLETEACFYREYPWCLNVFPTVHRISEYLTGELRRLDLVQED